jgi:hypothetical protein
LLAEVANEKLRPVACRAECAYRASGRIGSRSLPITVPAVLAQVYVQLEQARSGPERNSAELKRPDLEPLVWLNRNQLVATVGAPDYCDPPGGHGRPHSIHWACLIHTRSRFTAKCPVQLRLRPPAELGSGNSLYAVRRGRFCGVEVAGLVPVLRLVADPKSTAASERTKIARVYPVQIREGVHRFMSLSIKTGCWIGISGGGVRFLFSRSRVRQFA